MELDKLKDVDLVAVSTEKLLAKSISLKEFIELLGPRLTGTDLDERERGTEVVVSVLCKLPNDFLKQREVELLLDFLLSRFDESSLSGGAVIIGIRHLVLSSSELPMGYVKSLTQKIFVDGNVQEWGQKDRFALFEVLEYLIRERLEGIRSMGMEFVLGFVRSITGERDPRCLIITFRLFCKVTQLLSFGPFVEDLFDVVACYYPIEFKPSSSDTTGITRDMLVRACEDCLMAHPSFGPFTYQLIAEKLADDELDEDSKLEVCSFLARVCDIFPTSTLHQQLDDILAGVRMVALNPATKCATMPQQILTAVQAIVTRLSNGFDKGLNAINYICNDFIENFEPFVLQSEMGMSGRSLALLEVLAQCHPKMSKTVTEKALGWLLMVAKGETINSVANREEVVEEAFKYLPRWCKLAISTGNDSLVVFHQKSLIDVVQESKSKTARYSMGEVFVSVWNTDNAMTNFYDELLSQSLEDIKCDDKKLRSCCLSFVRTFSFHYWSVFAKMLHSHIDPLRDSPDVIPVLCAAICHIESVHFVLPFLQPLISRPEAWSTTNLECLVAMFLCNKSQQDICEVLFRHIFCSLILATDDTLLEHSSALAGCIQDIGLILDPKIHSNIMRFLTEHVERRSVLFPLVYLFATQSENTEEMSIILDKLPPNGVEWHKIVLMGAIVNKASDFEDKMAQFDVICSKFSEESQLSYKAVICRHLLLTARPQGWTIFEELLGSVKRHPKDELSLSKALCEVVDLDSRWSDVSKCAYHSTVLARQRIFCQMLPILVRHFNQLPKDAVCARSAYFKLLCPLLRMAEKISVPLNHEYLKLMPIFCEALDATELTLATEETILNGLVRLIKASSREELQADFIAKLIPKLRHFVADGGSIRLILSALECLEVIAQRCEPTLLLPYFGDVVSSIIVATGSKKRKIRSCAANVRNLWELLPTK